MAQVSAIEERDQEAQGLLTESPAPHCAARRGALFGGLVTMMVVFGACVGSRSAKPAGLVPESSSGSAPVALADQKGAGDATCSCIGIIGMKGEYLYSGMNVTSDFGGQCSAWDADMDDCNPTDDSPAPDWCAKEWCYVDPCSCGLEIPPKPTVMDSAKFQGKPLYWSYATCGSEDSFSDEDADLTAVAAEIAEACAEAPPEDDWGNVDCECRGYAGITGHMDTKDGWSYPGDAGAKCKAWDDGSNPDCASEGPPDWCAKKWCYVDPCKCDVDAIGAPPQKTVLLPGKFASDDVAVYWSYATCGEENAYSDKDALPKGLCGDDDDDVNDDDANQKLAGDATCSCIGLIGQTGEYLYSGMKVTSDFGGQCSAWDADSDGCNPTDGSPVPDWCAKEWCYVDPCSCDLETPPKPSALLDSVKFQGKPLYWSYATCSSNDSFSDEGADLTAVAAEIAEACAETPPEDAWGHVDCGCRGYSGITGFMETTDGWSYPGSVGAKCKAWDQGTHPDCASEDPPDWCAKKWCYVDPCKCDVDAIGAPPQPSDVLTGKFSSDGVAVYWSYATCGEENTYNYKDALPKDLCD